MKFMFNLFPTRRDLPITAFSPTKLTRQNRPNFLRLEICALHLPVDTFTAMAKLQDSKKAAKKEKAVKTKTAGLSEDRVVDSDSESEQKKVKTPVKAAEKVKKTKTSTKKAAPPPPTPPPAKKEESSDVGEEEESEDSDDSDDLDGDDESMASESGNVAAPAPAPAKAKANGVKKRKAEEKSSSSSEGEEDGSESDESLADVAQSQPPAAKKAKTQRKAPSPVETAQPEPAAPTSAPAEPLSSIPANAFTAPKDFLPIDVAKLHSTFPSNLAGKQVWHITAPSSLSISEIKSIGTAAIGNGSTVLTHKGSDYRLSEETSTSNTAVSVFLPGKEGYKKSEVPVEKTLHLQQKIELPKLTSKQAKTETGGEAAVDVWKPVEEGARPQPKGMRMRYKPPGFGLGEPGLGSDDDEGEGFKLPKSKKAKKARRESGDAMEGVESTGKELSKEERKKAKKEAKVRAANGA